MLAWKRFLVVLPAFAILHLTATGAVPLAEGFRTLWRPGAYDEILLLAGFPAGYAMGAAVGMTTAPGTTRLALALSLILSILGLYWFAEWASDYAGGAAALALTGLAAGITMPAAARVLGLNRNIAGGIIMALLVAAAWWLSVPFVEFFKQGLPIGGTPGWTGPYYAQGALCVIWLPLVLFAGGDRGPGRRR